MPGVPAAPAGAAGAAPGTGAEAAARPSSGRDSTRPAGTTGRATGAPGATVADQPTALTADTTATSTATFTRCQKHHIGAIHSFAKCFNALTRSCLSNIRIGTSTQASSYLFTDMNLIGS